MNEWMIMSSDDDDDKNLHYAVNAVLTVKPERRDEFIQVIKQDQAQTLATEPGAVRFVVGQQQDDAAAAPGSDSNTFYYLHEEYVNQAAYEQHTKTPHFAVFDKFCASQPWAEGGEPQALFYHVQPVEADTSSKNKKQTSAAVVAGQYCLHARLTLQPERRAEFIQIFSADQVQTLANEPDSVHFVFGTAAAADADAASGDDSGDTTTTTDNNNSNNTFVIFEQYKSKAAFEQHNAMPHYKPWADFCQTNPFVAGSGEPVVAFYYTI